MLKTKQVTVDETTYTVTQMSVLEQVRLRLFIKQIEPDIEKIEKNKDMDELERQARIETLQEWAFVAACSAPLIDRVYFLSAPVLEIKPLIDTAEELNADLTPDATITTAKQAKKKKSNLRPNSSSE